MDVAGLVHVAGNASQSHVDSLDGLCLLAGVPLFVYALRALVAEGVVDQLVIVAPAGRVGEVGGALGTFLPGAAVAVVPGSPSHRHCLLCSLHEGLLRVESRVGAVVVHEAARPLVSPAVVSRVVAAVRAGADLAVPVLEVTDTVKETDPAGQVAGTVPRQSLLRLQAPPAVRRTALAAAHDGCDGSGSTALSLAAPGARAVTVPGEDAGFVVRTAADLALAEAVLSAGRATR